MCTDRRAPQTGATCACNTGYSGNGTVCIGMMDMRWPPLTFGRHEWMCRWSQPVQFQRELHGQCGSTDWRYMCMQCRLHWHRTCLYWYVETVIMMCVLIIADTNGCAAGVNPCHANATCTDIVAPMTGATCVCRLGFTGNGTHCEGSTLDTRSFFNSQKSTAAYRTRATHWPPVLTWHLPALASPAYATRATLVLDFHASVC
jgi:hypothetical protein